MAKPSFKEKSLSATLLLIAVMAVLFTITYFFISRVIEKRCLERMQEGVRTVTEEVSDKVLWESLFLNSAADVLSQMDSFGREDFQKAFLSLSPILRAMNVSVLLPDNTAIRFDGSTMDAGGLLSFDSLSTLGEHIAVCPAGSMDYSPSDDTDYLADGILDNDVSVLRHFVPVVKNGEVTAILYGVTMLSDLPSLINISNIYNSSSSAYIIDRETGDFIMNTWRDEPSNIHEIAPLKTKKGQSWEAAVLSIQNGESGYVVYYSESASQWLYLCYAPSTINSWSVAVSVPEPEALASVIMIRRLFFLFTFLVFLADAIYYFWVRRNREKTMEKIVKQTVLEEMLHKAESAEKAKSMFLSNMSHDIRTPMNAIIGYTTLARSCPGNPEKTQEYLDKILSSGNHLLSLINDVLDMSRIESGKLNIEEKECSISDIFRDMRNIIQTQMQTKQLDFFMDTLDILDENIYCDKLHLNQILLNLLSNAIKFTPAGGFVSLTIKQLPGAPTGYGSYEIRVKDNGIGMSRDFVEHLFKPFEREQTSTVSGIQGSGLGMAITKNIVDAMGGSIRVETQQGEGTEFIIDLQFRLQDSHKQLQAVPELEGKKVLVVDDNFDTCDSITKMLRQLGMLPEWTLHGKEAVLRARQAREMEDLFYAFVVDWMLPDLNGLEVARQIRAAVGPECPIILLTAYDWDAIADEAKKAGVTAFCSKPLFLSDLRDTLLSFIGKTEPVLLPPSPAGEAVRPALQGKRLLLVEDNPFNREIAEELLKEEGFVVETAENGQIAVDMVVKNAARRYDLILMDVQMPVMDGYEATRAIRKLSDPALASIPIIAMTANAFEEDRKAALESGMNAHVAKPVDMEKLKATIEKFLPC